MLRRCLYSLLLVASSLVAQASIIEDYQQYLVDGELRILHTEHQAYPSIWLEHQGAVQRGVVSLYPNWGEHPEAADDIARLRRQLSDRGWQTIAYYPPQPAHAPSQETLSQHERDNYQPQLRALVDLSTNILQALPDDPGPQLVIAQGMMGAWLVELYVAHSLAVPNALVLVDVYQGDRASNRRLAEHLAQLEIPILDIHHAQRHPWLEQASTLRMQTMQRNARHDYRQHTLNTNTSASDDALGRYIYGWLHTQHFYP